MNYYWVDAITGMIVQIWGDSTPTPPAGLLGVSVQPADDRMVWNLVDAWIWDITGLKNLAFSTFSEAINAPLIFDSNSLFPTNGNWLSVFLQAENETAAANRNFVFDTDTVINFTNADLITAVIGNFDLIQQAHDIYPLVVADIVSGLITDPDGIASAWASYALAYINSRVKLPLYSDLVAAFDALSIPAAQVQSNWNATSGIGVILNKPSLLSEFSNDPGFVNSAALAAGLAGKDASGAASAAQAYAVQRSNHTGTQSAGTVTGLATVATSGAYGDLTGIPTIGKAYVGTTAKGNAFPAFLSATVASGVAVFQFTVDGTSTGAPLFPNEVFTDSVCPAINDASAAYQIGWAWSNGNKTLTVTVNKLGLVNILSGLIGQSAANGAVVKVTAWGR